MEKFWKMIYQQNVSKIICLSQTVGTNTLENKTEACLYFPTEENPQIQFKNENYEIDIILNKEKS